MLPAERNYETHEIELLAIVKVFKKWRHYLEGVVYTIFVRINHNNLKKFMETTRLNGRQIRWAENLSRYEFEIDHCPKTKKLADKLSRRLTDEYTKKELVE